MEKLETSSGILFERVKPGRVIFTSVLDLTAQVKKLHESICAVSKGAIDDGVMDSLPLHMLT